MKKEYKKPLFALEEFTPSQVIARDCGKYIDKVIDKERLTLADIGQCVWDLGDGFTTVFLANSACMLDGEMMGYGCYNNPTEDYLIFRS